MVSRIHRPHYKSPISGSSAKHRENEVLERLRQERLIQELTTEDPRENNMLNQLPHEILLKIIRMKMLFEHLDRKKHELEKLEQAIKWWDKKFAPQYNYFVQQEIKGDCNCLKSGACRQ